MMPAPSGSQEHRQRLPPTPIANRGRTTLFGQSAMGMGASANRNPLGTMNGNSHKVGGGFVGGGYGYGK